MQRALFDITGPDAADFLQNLVTNDVTRGPLVYAALLTPQGKYLSDFFLLRREDGFTLDCPAEQADALVKRLTMYKLRAKVTIAPSDLSVSRGRGAPPEGALPDPRHEALGWRHYAESPAPGDHDGWDELRVAHCIPEAGAELIPDDSYILEAGFDRLHGVDFRKGCYVGQEVTARMHHKTELRKGFRRVAVEGEVEPGAEITSDGKPVGRLTTLAGDAGIAYLRFDRAGGEMQAGPAVIRLIEG